MLVLEVWLKSMEWSLEESSVKIKNKTLLSDIRENSKFITKESFDHSLTYVLLCAARVGDDALEILQHLLTLLLQFYSIDHLFEYTVYTSSESTHPVLGFPSKASTYIVTPPEYPGTPFSLQGTLMHITTEAGNLKGIQILLKHGASIDALNCCGRTPLMMCADNPNPTVAKFLIDNGCNVNLQDKSGQTMLILLCNGIKQFKSLFKPLLKAGANPTIADQYGKTMVHYVCESCSPSSSSAASFVSMLFENGIMDGTY